MKKKQYARYQPEPIPDDTGSLIETITRFWVTIAVIAVIVYASALVISRTDGFRGIVRQRIETMTGLTLSIDRIYASPALDLVMEGIKEANATNHVPVVDIERAELYWRVIPMFRGSGWPFSRLHIRGCNLRFTPGPEGTWTPLPKIQQAVLPWIGLAPRETADDPEMHVTEYLRRVKARVELENVRLAWLGATDDAPLAATVEGLFFSCQPVRPMSQDVLWCTMKIARAETSGYEWVRNLDLEWIRQFDQDVVLRLSGETTRIPETYPPAVPKKPSIQTYVEP